MTIDRSGQRPDSYQGVNPAQNPPLIKAVRDPATGDRRFKIGTLWINTSSNQSWFLTSVVAGSATWALASPGASDVDTINSLSPTAGNIIIDGGTNLTDSNAGSTVTMNMDAAITLATSVSSPIYTSTGAIDTNINAVAGQDIIVMMGDAAAANKVSFVDSASAEVASIDSNGAFTTTGLTFTGLLTANASATINTAGTTLNLATDNSGDIVNLGTGTVARAINIGSSAAAHTLTIGSVTGAASLDLLAGTGNFTLEGNVATTYGISATGVNTGTISIGTGTGAQTLNLMTGGTGVKTVNLATGAIGNIVTIGTVTAAASLDLLVGTGNFTLEGNVASTYDISATGANTGTVTIAAGTGARTVNLATGGTGVKTVNLATGAIGNIVTIGTVTAAASLDLLCGTGNFTLEGNVASTYDISSTGVNTGTVTIASGTGARTVEVAGGGTGIKTINIGAAATADVITIGSTTAAGSTTIAAGTGDITLSGNVKTVTAEHIVSLGTNLTVSQSPIMQASATTGVAPTGVAGAVNLMYMQDGALMEQFIIGTQTIIAPRMSANGLAIELDNINAEGAEYNFGARANAKHAYTIGTSAAFFFSATLTVVDLSGCAPLMIGFRKVEANNATLGSYTDYFCAGINQATSATEVVLLDELNGGGQTITNSTTAWTGGDTGTTTINVLVSAAGVCTYTIDGGAPAVTNAVTFDNADVVMPFIHFVNGADVAGEVALSALSCGFQA